MTDLIQIRTLMETSGVRFGTSGARGLVTQLTDRVAYAYASAFLQYLERNGEIRERTQVGLAGDRRSSTPRIQNAIARAVSDRGHFPIDWGKVPSPALALSGFDRKVPSIMVTGSHIPEDRNGIKFNTARGEITKADEIGIATQEIALPDRFTPDGTLKASERLAALEPDLAAAHGYVARYLDTFPEHALEGLRIGLYGHSAVGRELLHEILDGLGAQVVRLGFCEEFVSVDTEAIRPEDVRLAADWAREGNLSSIVSTDGDSDRPLISDEHGRFVRGDVAGILCARHLGASDVVTPVSSNSALERCSAFRRVVRTQIGSPFVIEGMRRAMAEGGERVVGYEANGGFLTSSAIPLPRGVLTALPTRDAVIVILSILTQAQSMNRSVSALLATLPARYTASDRLEEFPAERSQPRLQELRSGGTSAAEELFGTALGAVRSIDTLDGVRIEFATGEVIHLRASGNAPELRCYSEADSPERARILLDLGLSAVKAWR